MTTDQAVTTKQVTITLPNINVSALAKRITGHLSQLFSNIYNPLSSRASQISEGVNKQSSNVRMPRMNRFKFDKSKLKIIFPVLLGIVVIAAIVNIARTLPDAKSSPDTAAEIPSPDAIATINLDKKFAFPLRDEKGKTVGTFDYIVESANLQRQIIVQGQRATAVDNRVFLILNLKITNTQKQMIQLNTRDFLRLVVASTPNEQLAPDIHNDPVEVQAISTKYTRVGIAIDEEDARKTIKLIVGEIDGDKQNIDLNFKY